MIITLYFNALTDTTATEESTKEETTTKESTEAKLDNNMVRICGPNFQRK